MPDTGTGSPAFRSAIVGGFNRDDVVAYLAGLTEERNRETDAANAELEALRAELAKAESKIGELESERDGAASSERERANRAEERAACLETKLSETVAKYNEANESLETSKRHLVDMELSARERSEKVEREANERSERVEREANERSERVEREANERVEALRAAYRERFAAACSDYASFRSEADGMIGAIKRELDVVGGLFDSLSIGLGESQKRFDEIMARLSDNGE